MSFDQVTFVLTFMDRRGAEGKSAGIFNVHLFLKPTGQADELRLSTRVNLWPYVYSDSCLSEALDALIL